MPSVEADTPPAAEKANPRNNPTMFQIFQNVQYNVVQHKKYVKEMTKLYKKMDEESFRESFKNALFYLFTFGDTSANVDRVVQFVATFCTTLDDEEEFLLFIFDIIFNCQCLSGQSIRYRASQLLAAVLAALGEDASLDDDLCDKLLESQMQRLQDTRGAVRCRAALALQRLQNPMESDDEVTRAYRFHMSCDPSSSVRRAVVMSIAKCARNVPFVLERLCDVDEAVRRAAFLYVAAINVTQLRVRQRLITLKVGLTERSPRVRRVVEEILVPGWLATFKGNIIDLLKAIRLDNAHDAKDSQEVAGKLLESLFKRLPVSELLEWLPTDKELRLIPAERLNKETAWYWRHLAEHLQRADDDETLETVLPDLLVLTGYIKAIVESPCPDETEDPVGFGTRQHVLHELARLLHVYDAGDPAGRAALQQVITDALTGDYGPLNADVIRALVLSLETVVPEAARRVEAVCGIISELREPVDAEPAPAPPAAPPAAPLDGEAKLQRARLRVSLNVAMEAQEEAVRDQNYALAEECKAKVKDIQKKIDQLNAEPTPPPPSPPKPTLREKLSDAATLNKCLNILNCLLDTPQITSITPMLKMIFSELEVEIFQNPDIVESALETVALYGMLDKEFARENKAFFFANLIDTTNERVVPTVLKCLVDLLCVHGANVFEDDDVTHGDGKGGNKKRLTYDTLDEDGMESMSMSQGHSTVIELLLKIMEGTYSAYRLIIAEGLCRLLHLGHLESPTILSRLLLLWFNPATVDEDMLRQIIGVFFQSFASTVEGAQEQIQKATIPTLRALANAPSSSPIAEIDQEAVVRFIVSLTRVNHELSDSQGAMALQLCSQLVARPGGAEVALVCRLLALLAPPRDACAGADLAAMLRDMSLKLPDKQSCRNLTRYLGALEATIVHKASVSHAEDSLLHGRATTSLPQPIARSTHVVINETVEEEPEIDETSPPEAFSRISEEPVSAEDQPASPREPGRASGGSESSRPSDPRGTDSDSDGGVSPVKKAKVHKGKKLSINRGGSGSDGAAKGKKEKAAAKASKKKKTGDAKETAEESENSGGVKRSRSQRSLVDVDRAKKNGKEKAQTEKAAERAPTPKFDLDASNVTVRRSVRGSQSGCSSDSGSGKESAKDKKEVPAKAKGGKAKPVEDGNRETDRVPKFDLDSSNVTVRRSVRGPQSGCSSDSGSGKECAKGKTEATAKAKGGKAKPAAKAKGKAAKKPAKQPESPRGSDDSGREPSLFDDSDDTQLHTIVYDQGMEQSLLNDSEELPDSTEVSRATNVTIPETPEGSDESQSEPEPEPEPKPAKTKGKPKPKGK